MEVLTGTAAGILVVFLCLFCLRYGYRAGRAEKENRPLPPMINKPVKKDEERKPSALSQFLGANGDSK